MGPLTAKPADISNKEVIARSLFDVLVDQEGRVRAAVIDFGGFLGVGSRKIVADWTALRFAPGEEGDRVTLDLTRNQVKQAPDKDGKPVVVLGTLGTRPSIP